MANPRQPRNLIFNFRLIARTVALAIACMLIAVAFQPAQAQTFTVLHNFTGGQDGANPFAGVTLDRAGNLYGTTFRGSDGYGTVYKLAHKGSSWIFSPLYSFARDGSHGASPEARVNFGPNGTLFGTTGFGGIGYGTVFNLKPALTVCKSTLCPWTESVLDAFPGHPGGNGPSFGDLLFDEGNIYGTTGNGGTSDLGAVFQISPSATGWTESVLYSFCSQANCADGVFPWSGVISDDAGNLYGTTYEGGSSGYGTVFELSPGESGWTEKVLYNFQGGTDGSFPVAGLLFDPSGNLYGTTSNGYYGCCGTVFKLTPAGDGNWTYSLVYSFTGSGGCGNYGPGPYYALVMDEGNLYGTTDCNGASNAGAVFKLTPSGNGWTYTSLHDFTGGSDGRNPFSNVAFDANGNLYGTTYSGGTSQNCNGGCGVVWEITP